MLPSNPPEGNVEATGPSGPASSAQADSAFVDSDFGHGFALRDGDMEYVQAFTTTVSYVVPALTHVQCLNL